MIRECIEAANGIEAAASGVSPAPKRILLVDASLRSVGSTATLTEGESFQSIGINQAHDIRTTVFCIEDRVKQHDVDEVRVTMTGAGAALVDALNAAGIHAVAVPEVRKVTKNRGYILVSPGVIGSLLQLPVGLDVVSFSISTSGQELAVYVRGDAIDVHGSELRPVYKTEDGRTVLVQVDQVPPTAPAGE